MRSAARQLFPLLFAVFVSMLGVGIISPLLPIYAEMLGAGGLALGVIFGLFSLSRAAVMPFYGRLSDLKGRKIFITAGLAAYSLTSLAYVAADSVAALALIRLFHGLASAAILPIVMAYVGDITPEGQEGRYMGIFSTSLLAGFGSGPFIGGLIKDSLGIEAAFYVMGALVLVGLLLVVTMVKEPEQRRKVPGKYPLRRLLSSRRLRALFTYRFVGAVGRGAVFAFLPIFAHDVLSLSASGIGLLLSAVVLTTSILQTPFGILADRCSRTTLVAAGGVLNVLGLLAVVHSTNLAVLLAAIGLMGVSGAMAMPALTALAVDEGRETGMGSVMGIFNLAMSLGQSLGPFSAGWLMDLTDASAPFYFAAAVILLGTLLFVVEIRAHEKNGSSLS